MLQVCRYCVTVVPRFSICNRRYSEKKDLGSSFPTKYDRTVDNDWYDWWQEKGFFKPNCSNDIDILEKERFSMILPPPNVTGVLHLGHALTATIQDTLVRYHRMRGSRTVWIPGCDHAGIATQVVVEKKLLAEKDLTRQELGRDAFIEEVIKWQKDKGGHILDQLKLLGASLDWSRNQFTLSDTFKHAVDEAFIRLFEAGLIYRSDQKMINWCPALESAISDMEIEHIEVNGRTLLNVPSYTKPVTFGVMTNIAYKLVNKPNLEIVVGTTRPETMLGDTGVAVHPSDQRYSELHGEMVWHPFRQEAIPIITDDYVNPAVGTGALKVTPAHDRDDLELGKRHNLATLLVLDEKGNISKDLGKFSGQNRFKARTTVCQELEAMGCLRGETDHPMTIPICVRTGDVIEPLVRPQWFMKTQQLAAKAMKVVKEKELKLHPSSYETIWNSFMEGNEDWCLSRQIWWGHQIPAYYCSFNKRNCWVAARDGNEAKVKAVEKLNLRNEDQDRLSVTKDGDVLDTWFSSGLYPFAALGWPSEESLDYEQFYPLNLLETGNDILFFWVGRMVMLGLALTDILPFSDVLLHGVVTDSQGRKMSKSLGNVVDPVHLVEGASLEDLESSLSQSVAGGYLDKAEFELAMKNLRTQWPNGIPAQGVDSLRWALASYDIKSAHIGLEPSVIHSAGAWCNKIWQLARFLNAAHLRANDECFRSNKDFQPRLMDMWILNQLANTTEKVNHYFQTNEFHLATRQLRSFIYGDLCDIYVEYVKPDLADSTQSDFYPSLVILHSCVLSSLKLLHPIMPFITEELFQRLPLLPSERRKESLMIDAFPQYNQWSGFVNEDLENTVAHALRLVTDLRSIKATYNIGKATLPSVLIATQDTEMEKCVALIQRLANCGDITFSTDEVNYHELPKGYVSLSSQDNSVYVNIGEYINYDREMKKLEDNLATIERQRLKLAKSQKGKFKYRISPEKFSSKQSELDSMETELRNKMTVIKQLKEERLH